MPTIPCISKIDSCLPCDDFPILNLSSEAVDVDRYLSRFAFLNAIPPIRQYPDFDEQGGGIFLQVGCMRWCWSTISQDDADDCARRQAIECAFNPLTPGFPIPTPFSPNRIALYYNDAVAGTYTCPDGNVFSYTIAANQIVALTQGEANAIAFALAKLRAKQHRVCISDMDDPICVDTWVTKQITASGPNVAVFPATDRWELVSGTIPPGMTLETGFTSDGIEFSGIPTVIGEYSFRVRVTISTFGSPGFGDFMEKVFTVKIVGIEQSSPLPDAVIGQAYSQQLSAAFSSNHELEIWSITSGSLPDGLTLSTAGLIEGTPAGSPNTGYIFTIQAQFPAGTTTAVCSKSFTITTTQLSLLAYWPMDETGVNPNRIDSAHGLVMSVIADSVPVQMPGKIVNCALFSASGLLQTHELRTPQQVEMSYNGEDITIAFWVLFQSQGIVNEGYPSHKLLSYELFTSGGSLRGVFAISYLPFTDSIFARVENLVGVTNTGILTPVNLGQWYLIQAIYNASTGIVNFRVDNGSTQVGAFGRIIPTSDKGLFSARLATPLPGLDSTVFQIDEAGCWLRALTDPELDSLWNGGSGVSYPNVPQ